MMEGPLWHRIQALLDTGEVERGEFGGAELAGLFFKARRADRDARNGSLYIDSRSTLAYQALHQYSDVLARLHGFRVKQGRRHHRNLFQVVHALQIDGAGNLDADAESAARGRTRSFYGLEATSETTVAGILALNERLRVVVRRELLARHPDQADVVDAAW
ncbi:MAG TPA: hypothetical protein VF862_02490 [Gemmatimonadales bacterium]